MSEHKNRLFILYPILIVFIAVVYTFVSFFVPLVGDDLAHIRDYGTNYPSLVVSQVYSRTLDKYQWALGKSSDANDDESSASVGELSFKWSDDCCIFCARC